MLNDTDFINIMTLSMCCAKSKVMFMRYHKRKAIMISPRIFPISQHTYMEVSKMMSMPGNSKISFGKP